VTEFWRRWHISLSTWLRDYLYISLGGNRGTKLFTYRNLMLTMVLGGLWHGASWNFVIWGGIHGLALIVHREWVRLTENAGTAFKRVMSIVAVPVTFYYICVTWIFFRATDTFSDKTHQLEFTGFQNAIAALKDFTFIGRRGKIGTTWECVGILALLALVHWLNSQRILGNWWRRLPDWAAAALLGVGTAIALIFVPVKYKPFIYFQF
jgi:alginate O-acetyltransferase complex protein AlgI